MQARKLCFLLLFVSSGCVDVGESCTLVACMDELNITLRPEGAAFQEGTYEVAIGENLGEPLRCSFTVSGAGFGQSDCGESAADGSITVHVPVAPPTIALDVARDGQVVVDEELTPTYEEVFPNGRDCGAGCSRGQVEHTL